MVEMSQQADDEIPEKYPWPTHIYARLINNLNRAGASVILMDVVFDQPDLYDLKNDTLFAEAVRNHGKVVLAGQINTVATNFGEQTVEVFPREILREYNPNPVGMVAMMPDMDGFIRRYSLGTEHLGTSYYTIGIEALRLYLDIPEKDTGRGADNFRIGDNIIPASAGNSFLINYYGPEKTFPVYSLDAVIDDTSYTTVMEAEAFEMNLFDNPETQTGLLYDEVFKDKIVVVGSTMPLLKDFYPTPYADKYFPRPGYEIHAHAMQTVLDAAYLHIQSSAAVLAGMLALAFAVVFINKKAGMLSGAAVTVLLFGAYLYLTYLFFTAHNLFLNLTATGITLAVSQVFAIGFEALTAEQERRRIESMFSAYVSPELVKQMVRTGEQPALGGEERRLTALFSDVEAFSTIAEQLDARQLVRLMNEYLSPMTEVITSQQGTLDKYVGDAIVAFFGAPLPVENHAVLACRTALQMQHEMEVLKEKWLQEGWPEAITRMKTRIGINTGAMVAGNMGSDRRFNYTVMGDHVNIAARCESAAARYGVYTVVTEYTKTEAEEHTGEFLFRQLDTVVVKGRSRPVKVFEIMNFKPAASPEQLECAGYFERGLEAYYARDWAAALKYFEQAKSLEAYEVNPSGVFIERCRQMMAAPPAEDWTGVYVLREK